MVLKSKVVIGYCDVACAGCRALLGANLENFDITQLHLQCSKESGLSTVVKDIPGLSNESQPTVLQLNHKIQDVSIVVINTEFEPHLIHVAAAEIIDIVRNSDVEELVILSAIPLSLGDGFHKLIDQGKELVGGCSVTDQLLNTLLQFVKIETFRTTLVAVDGKKAKLNCKPNTIDGSEQNIRQIHEFLSSEVINEFNLEKSLSLVFNRQRLDDDQTDKIELMYL